MKKRIMIICFTMLLAVSLTACSFDSLIEGSKQEGKILNIRDSNVPTGLYIASEKGDLKAPLVLDSGTAAGIPETEQDDEGNKYYRIDTSRYFYLKSGKKIPTLYDGESLICISDTDIADKFTAEHFAPPVESFGFIDLQRNENNTVTITEDNCISDSQASQAYQSMVGSGLGQASVHITEIDGVPIGENKISSQGFLQGYTPDKSHEITFLKGTKTYKGTFTCDQEYLCVNNVFETNGYKLTDGGYAVINIDNLLDGIYNIGGMGLIRIDRSHKRPGTTHKKTKNGGTKNGRT